jgi:hypothetical protein
MRLFEAEECPTAVDQTVRCAIRGLVDDGFEGRCAMDHNQLVCMGRPGYLVTTTLSDLRSFAREGTPLVKKAHVVFFPAKLTTFDYQERRDGAHSLQTQIGPEGPLTCSYLKVRFNPTNS